MTAELTRDTGNEPERAAALKLPKGQMEASWVERELPYFFLAWRGTSRWPGVEERVQVATYI